MKRIELILWGALVLFGALIILDIGARETRLSAAVWPDSTLQKAVSNDAPKWIFNAAGVPEPAALAEPVIRRAEALEARVAALEVLCDLLAREVLIRTYQMEEMRLGVENAPPRPGGLHPPYLEDIIRAWRDVKGRKPE